MAWWNWALVLWATGATVGMAGLGVVLATRVGGQRQVPASDDGLAVFDGESRHPVGPARNPAPRALARHVDPGGTVAGPRG